MSEANNIAAIVVTYNRLNLLKENIQALLMQSFKKIDIYVIDNGSTDGTGDYIKSQHVNRLIYVNTGSNLGGAGGFSFGIKYTLSSKDYDYLWLMDDDTIPNNDALESLYNKAQYLEKKFSYLASIVNWIDGSKCKMNLQPLESSSVSDWAFDQGLVRIKQSSFVSCFINCMVVKKVGLPIKEFFIYGDDVEYTKRMEKKAPGYLDMDSVVVHKMASNSSGGIDACDKHRINRYFYCYRNFVYIAKHNSLSFCISFARDTVRMIGSVLKRSQGHKLYRIATIFCGLISGIFFHPKVEYLSAK